jgi:hypothetical protein
VRSRKPRPAGTAPITLTAAASDILLNTQANNLSGTVAFGGTLANVRDFALRNTNAAASVPTLSTLTNLRKPDAFNSTMPRSRCRRSRPAGANASVTAGGAITQAGALVVAGHLELQTGSSPITLTNAANNFTGR